MKTMKILTLVMIFIICICNINISNAVDIEITDSVQIALDDIISSGSDFLELGSGSDVIDSTQIKEVSDSIYNVLLGIFMFLAVVVGILLGIKYMISGNDDKADVKQTLIPYFVAVFIMFSAFSIWKLVIILFE